MTARLLPASLLLALLATPALAGPSAPPQPLGAIASFSLTDQSGRTVTLDDLKGKVWVASFILARCPDGKCPEVTKTVAKLQEKLAGRDDVRLVSFVLDRDLADAPAVMRRYAEQHNADPERWLFLAGPEDALERVQRSFKSRPDGDKVPEAKVPPHSQRLFVVDRSGDWRGIHDGTPPFGDETEADRVAFARGQRRLVLQVEKLLQPDLPAWMPADFPAFNASLNALSGALILLGYFAIRRRLVRLHIACMASALLVSAVFLASYLFFHLYVKGGRPTRFSEQAVGAPEWVAYLYAVILGSHTVLAAVVTPLALWVAYLGVRNRLAGHVRLARWALPLWVYVSVTGVVVYWMLYRLYPLVDGSGTMGGV